MICFSFKKFLFSEQKIKGIIGYFKDDNPCERLFPLGICVAIPLCGRGKSTAFSGKKWL
jgi:hypothetical protein